MLRGWAGPALLDTYQAERYAVAKHNVALSWAIWKDMSKARQTLGAVLGFSYESNAVVSDGTEPPEIADRVTDFVPSARPGSRAPHYFLDINGRRLSTIDLFDGAFVLLSPTRGWCTAAEEAASLLSVPLVSHVISDDEWARLYGVNGEGAVLVRPDGHVAWRANGSPEAGGKMLEHFLARVLGLHSTAEKQSA